MLGKNPKISTSTTKKGKQMELLIVALALSTVAVIAQLADVTTKRD